MGRLAAAGLYRGDRQRQRPRWTWDWVVGVFERIGDVSVYWLALAPRAQDGRVRPFIGLTWSIILR